MNQVRNIIKDQYVKLPPSIREFVRSTKLEDKIDALTNAYALSSEVAQTVSDETLLVIMGLSPFAELSANIAKEAEIPEDTAYTISTEITADLIVPIADDLADFLEKEEKEELREELSSPPTTRIAGREKVAIKPPIEHTEERSKVTKESEVATVRQMLRENSKTVDIKDFLANLK
ncbi:MAG: hypothetical protein OQJ98_03135 [Candidatus Pacebacteria bacterium]|nr:hypothetical protein [Candidatus Paceibacterota bacterium]